ncbi:hypothetical protein [Paenibacillus qinlingensis]|uniref:Uncharacterized protein n=1 Tax=Paenibacillus qinlingensis TaxID=1837343 RepID=A0ABU1NNU7_9BACL|nr:hypothetical protein [Paenibacillus qinlingensis]MDR6549161.1 hypothetical protein [Paenibacillus qinlingensis]
MDIDAFLAEVLESNEDWHVTMKDGISIIDSAVEREIPFDNTDDYLESGF